MEHSACPPSSLEETSRERIGRAIKGRLRPSKLPDLAENSVQALPAIDEGDAVNFLT
jgi:hypothetical protein